MDAVRFGSSLVSLAYSRTDISFSSQSQSTNRQKASDSDAVQLEYSPEAQELAALLKTDGQYSLPLPAAADKEQSSDLTSSIQSDPGLQTLLEGVKALIGEDSDWFARFQEGLKALQDALSGNWGGSAPASSDAEAAQSSTPANSQGLQIGSYASFSMEAHIAAVYATSAEGEVSIQQISIDIEMEAISMEAEGQANVADPLVLDLNRDGKISATGPENGILFDINGDGVNEKSAFVSGPDGALALDRNGDGTINGGNELFGDQNGAANGFLELGKYDDNQDGEINSLDSVFQKLKIVTRNEDGSLTLHPLSDYDIQSLQLNALAGHASLGDAGYLNAFSSYTTNSGRTGLAADAMLAYRA